MLVFSQNMTQRRKQRQGAVDHFLSTSQVVVMAMAMEATLSTGTVVGTLVGTLKCSSGLQVFLLRLYRPSRVVGLVLGFGSNSPREPAAQPPALVFLSPSN